MRTKRILISSILASIFIVTSSSSVLAAPPPAVRATCIPQPSQGVQIGDCVNNNFIGGKAPTSLGLFINGILGQVYTIALIVMTIYLIWGSYRYMISAGDPKAVAAARNHLTWAIAGMIIVFVSYWLYRVVNELTLYLFQDI